MSRLPAVSSDGNAWGTILNDFLGVAHNADGSIKNLFINVTDPVYGASPSNTAAQNDTAMAAAMAALPSNGPGVVFFPCIGTGIYKISQSIIVDKDNIALVAFGQRGTVTLQIDASADPAYALIVGNTKNVNNCLVSGLTFAGRSSTSSTGAGILFRCNGGQIRQTQVKFFGGMGINITTLAGTIFEIYLEDVNLVQNGYNSTSHGDGLVITAGISDCEYHRIVSAGDAAKTTTRNGFNSNGGQQKFIDCHAYFCSNDGLLSTGPGTQIIGGEWETNGSNGIESSADDLIIANVAAYANTGADISAYGQSVLTGNRLSSAAPQNMYVNSANGGVIADNMMSGSTISIIMDTGSSLYSIHDNKLTPTGGTAISAKTTNSKIHDNICTAGTIVEVTGAQGNAIHDNTVQSAITQIGTTTAIRNNSGFNPRGASVTQPAIAASTVAVTNTTGCDCTVLIKGGTLTLVSIGGSSTGITAAAVSGSVHSVRVPVGQTIAITYSVAPTWVWIGD